MNTPDDCPDEKLHALWEGGPELPTEIPTMSDDDIQKLEKLFSGDFKHAEAVQAAMNRLDRIMHQKPEIDLRGRGFDLSYHYEPNAPVDERWSVIDLNTYCGAPDAQAPMNFIGSGEDRPAALQDLCDQFDDYDERPRRKVRVIGLGHPEQPPEVVDDITFDDGLE